MDRAVKPQPVSKKAINDAYNDDFMFKEVACAVLLGTGSVLSGTWIMLGAWLCQSRISSSSSAGTSCHLQETNTVHTYSEKQFQTPEGK